MRPPERVAHELQMADRRVERALKERDYARRVRADEIARAVEMDGWTYTRIAGVLGISRQRVGQLYRGGSRPLAHVIRELS